MAQLKKFIPFTKIDAVQRIVYGVVTAERPDLAKEVCDYATTKPFYQKWSESFSKATDGKSLGNLRAMHGKVAAGKGVELNFNDDAKQIEMGFKVVDDDEWNKVDEGVYTGFSHGGKYVGSPWKDPQNPELKRYTCDPIEVSLVDNPCLPDARFTMIKIDGTTEERAFKSVIITEPSAADIAAKATELATAAGDATKWADHIPAARDALSKAAKPADKDEDEEVDDDKKKKKDAKDGKDDEADKAAGALEDAWDQVWQSKRDGKTFKKKADLVAHHEALDAATAEKSPSDSAKEIITAIGAELKKHSAKGDVLIKINRFAPVDGLSKAASAELLSKSLYDVGRLASLISELTWLQDALNYEALIQQDASLVPAQLKAAIGQLCGVLRRLVEEETADLIGAGDILEMAAGLVPHGHIDRLVKFAADTPAMAKSSEALQKVGARNSTADKQRIQKMHDLTCELDATCKAADAAKAAGEGDLAKVTDERDTLRKQLAELTPLLKAVFEDVKVIKAQPMPGGPARTVVDKSRDGQSGGDAASIEKLIDGMTPDQVVEFAIKAAHRKGITTGQS